MLINSPHFRHRPAGENVVDFPDSLVGLWRKSAWDYVLANHMNIELVVCDYEYYCEQNQYEDLKNSFVCLSSHFITVLCDEMCFGHELL